ncbi:MAG TPA: tetratricopeptide repeat protein [Thermoleophilaceae bacterium]|jgi:putative thioredoxin|nr:tetratricopeptide repeat protein [Thermoleophilaceae bacterium]
MTAVFDVDEQQFMDRVVERSREVPVVVDFWADWCGPCKALSPALEQAANSRAGKIELAKVDVDKNQMLAQSFGVRGIPAVKAFRDGRIVDEFTGAIPPAQVEKFFDRLVPSEADELASGEDEESLRRALELEPNHPDAAVALARLLVERGDLDEAEGLLEPLGHDFRAAGLAARIELVREGREPEGALQAWDEGDYERALELLQDALLSASDQTARDQIRKVMVAIFTELGPDSELASRHRRRLASALN